MTETERARDALYAIPSDLPRDQWVKSGMGFNAAGGDLETFDLWSAQADNYNAADCRATWHSFKPGGGVTAASLFGMARDYGWRDGSKQSPIQAPRKPAEPLRKPTHGMGAEVYARLETATDAHPYIVAKGAAGVPLDNLRVVPKGDSLTIARESVAGYLAVPAYAPDSELQSIQFIPPAGGKKLNLTGASMAGASFTIGTDGPVYLCEGIGQAWAIWQATGHRAVCCFGWGNVRRVAEAMRERDASARLVLVPDTGKEQDAAKIALEVGAAVVSMPPGWPQNSDVNDLAQRDGGDVLKMLLESATEPPKPPPLLKPVSVFDVLSNPSPPPGFVWAGYLPRGTVSLLGAHGGTGKSTLALMLGVCTALGRPLFGVETEQCKGLFVSLEDGTNIIRHRLAHICKTWAIDPEQLRDRLLIVDGTEHPELFTAETRGAGETTLSYFELYTLVKSENIGLVVVDNASDSFGGDEIQRRQVRAFMRALAEVARLTDCAVLLLAHVDKNTSRNRPAAAGSEAYSGSTAWHNSARSRLFLTRGEGGLLTLEHQKSNLGKMREPITLTWPDDDLPMLASDMPDVPAFITRMQGRADDGLAAALLKLIAEFESREQYCSPAVQARNNVHAMLKSEPAFLSLKLRPDDTRRIVNQCQRAKWLSQLDYRGHGRMHQRWMVTAEGRSFAGLPMPHTPTSPHIHEGACADESTNVGCPTPPHVLGGTGEAHTHNLINSGDLIPELKKRRGRPRKETTGGENE